jgi:3-methyl-2-oxobutanoate hydroxymethyltransferase
MHAPDDNAVTKMSVPQLRARKQEGRKIVAITAYDYTFAKIFDAAGADILLVGDSLGQAFEGMPNTLSVTVDQICYHGRAVARGALRAHIVGDMPFLSFQVSPEDTLRAAGKMLKEGSFEAVKLEGGEVIASHIARLVRAGIPVMGHLGLLPQSVHAMGGYRVQGKSEDARRAMLSDAKCLQDAGCYAIVLEGIPRDLADGITASIAIPTIGIGAGPGTDGQILVCYDMLGLSSHLPKFVRDFGQLHTHVDAAMRAYIDAVRAGTFPDDAYSYHSH